MKSLIIVLVALFGLNINAQILEPVKWNFEAVKLDEKGTYQIDLTATVDEGWYVYSQEMDEGGPIPTSFEFRTGRSPVEMLSTIEEIGEAKEGIDPMFEIFIRKYANTVTFRTTVKSNGAQSLDGELQYMCCDNSRCLPPETVEFSIKLP